MFHKSNYESNHINIIYLYFQKSKIVIIDEATSNVDLKTEEIIQRCIKETFRDKTVITIAHRLKTILDCDKILVLDKGEVKEWDSPAALLENPHSYFFSLYHEFY